MESTPTLLVVLDLIGVFFFAVSGNLLAARKDIDITGGLVLGLLAGLGGGIIRDVLLGVTPIALSEPIYLVPPFLAAAAVYLLGSLVHRVRLFIVIFDAGGLGLFCTFGTVRALDHGMPIVSALLLGVTTAVGGGLLRDVVANEIPAVFSGSDLYIIPATTGAALTALAVATDTWGPVASILIPVFAFSFRMIAWRMQWRVPPPMRGWTVRGIEGRRERSVFGRPGRKTARGDVGADRERDDRERDGREGDDDEDLSGDGGADDDGDHRDHPPGARR